MNNRVIGTCSLCGGDVVVPNVWFGVNPPVPRCSSCGATAQKPRLPVIPMKPHRVPRGYGYYEINSQRIREIKENSEWL